jgi:hypothetical protein
MNRKFTTAFLATVVGIAFSCNNDDDLSGIPALQPEFVSVNAPAVLIPGVSTDFGATIRGTENNKLESVSFEIFSKEDDSSISAIVKEATTPDEANAITWTGAESGTADLPNGDYYLQIIAKSERGLVNKRNYTFKVLALPGVCQEDGKVTIVLITTTSAPETGMGMIGDFAGSGWGTDLPMTRVEPGIYCVSSPITDGKEFKFRIDGQWSKQGKKDNCNDMDNARYNGTGSDVAVFNIPKFGGFGC